MLTAEGPKVLEYNVRMGDPEAQPIVMRLRSDMAELLMALGEGRLAAHEPHWSPNPSVCVVLASQGYPGKPEVGKVISGIAGAETHGGVKVFHAGTKFQDFQLLSTGGRVLGVTATAEDLPSAIACAYTAVSKVNFAGMHYRRDIGAKGLRRLSRDSRTSVSGRRTGEAPVPRGAS
jgi:phosphoribosylamine--glycine ligase